MGWRTGSLASALLVALVTAPAARASDSERIRQLEDEVAELKVLVRDLRARQEIPAVSGGPPGDHDAPSFAAPTLELHGFGHFQYDSSWNHPQGGGGLSSTNHFTNGGVDLFITSQVAEDLTFLNETVFEFGEDGANILDVERVLLQYHYADWLRISMGRGHTALGFWNHRFHHGTWLQTTIDRPLIFKFEDDGGIMPVHFVGLELSGTVEAGESYFSYTANVGNGRGRIVDSVQLVEDLNDQKMVSLMVSWHPLGTESFGIGANVLWDRIPRDEDDPSRDHEIEEAIAGFHFFYTEDPFEVIGEAQYIHHDDLKGRDHHGGYLQLGWVHGRIKPYYRADWLAIDAHDSFFAGLDGVEDTIQHTLGLRWDWRSFSSWKLELRRRLSDSVHATEASAQVSFAF